MIAITGEELDAIEKLIRKTTQGEWENHYHSGDIDDCSAWIERALRHEPNSERIEVVLTGTPNDDGSMPPDMVMVCVTGNGPQSRANAYFIAKAHFLVPLLVAEVRRLRDDRIGPSAHRQLLASFDMEVNLDDLAPIRSMSSYRKRGIVVADVGEEDDFGTRCRWCGEPLAYGRCITCDGSNDIPQRVRE